MKTLHQLWAFVRRDYLLASTSRLTFAWQVMTIFFAAPTMYYLGRFIQPASSSDLRPYGGDYFAFVIVGIACSGFFSAMMGAWASGLRNEHIGGTLDAVLVSPVPLVAVAAGASLWNTITAALQTGLYLLVGHVMFHLNLGRMNPVSAAAIVLVTMIVFAALGMISAALMLMFRSGDPLTGVLAGVSVLVAGIFYPTTVLSPALQRIAQWVPLTHTLQALRLSLLTGSGIAALEVEIMTLILFALLLMPVALMALHTAILMAKRLGTIIGQ